MGRTKKAEKKSWSIAVYFALIVVLIIVISVTFKFIDVVRSSKFDGSNSFTVASINGNEVDIISVSPKEGKLTKLDIKGTSSLKTVAELGVPIDGYIREKDGFTSSAKSFFLKNLFSLGRIKTNLTFIDFIRLTLSSGRVGSDKQVLKSVSFKDNTLGSLVSTLFIDPQISDENTSITITNSTSVLGLGNKVAKSVVDLGGNVVLVNSSQDNEKTSVIYYKNKNYTVKKLSNLLNIPAKQKDISSFSDIIIIIGEDRGDFPNL